MAQALRRLVELGEREEDAGVVCWEERVPDDQIYLMDIEILKRAIKRCKKYERR